ncbi:lipopolysaccharide kinase InaA family protein [Aurantibacter sp.]|uniref:lipopolysaccharide kinase InaA family protein n=1 Tax=Aurantibacter sp. TaxID=2807103 RepID=UPI0035C7EB3A
MQELFIHPNFTSLKSELQDCISNFEIKGEYVVKGARNSIKKYKVGDKVINIKSFKSPNLFNSFIYKYIRSSKAKRSFEYAVKLVEKGIKTPLPIAYFEASTFSGLKTSYYISEHVNYNFDFRDLIHKPKYPNRTLILEQFTAFTFKLHENNIDFLDHSPGNTLIVKKSDVDYEFYLIDLNRMRFKSMSFDNRMHNFRRLWLSKTMINIMSKTYSELYQKSTEETHKLMTKYSYEFQKKVNRKKLRKGKK